MIKRLIKNIIYILTFLIFNFSLHAIYISSDNPEEFVMEFLDNIKESNVHDLDRMMDDSYIHIHGTSLIEDKKTFLKKLSNRKRVYKEINVSSLQIKEVKDIYLVQCTLNIRVSNNNSFEELVARNIVSMIIIKDGLGFKIIHFQATKSS